MLAQSNAQTGESIGDQSRPPKVAIAMGVIIILALSAGFAVAATLAISRRHYEIITEASRGSGGGQVVAFTGAEAVRVGIGFLGTAVMLSGWAAALASVIGRRRARWASVAFMLSAIGFVTLVPCLFPPWRIGRSVILTGVYGALALVTLLLEASRRRRLNRLVVYLSALAFVSVIAVGALARSDGVLLAEGVGIGVLLAAIGYGHWLVSRSAQLHH